MKLSKAEEELMNHLWEAKKAYMKDLVVAYSEPKPATTTIATMLKRMTNKGVIGYSTVGKSREYYPLIEKKKYFSNHLTNLITNFFNGSTTQFASFFTEEVNLSESELEDLKQVIEEQIEKKKK
jgi:predicted transcriptional regulator